MAEYPSMPLFTDAFLGDTLHLNAMQVGAYMLLLMAAWRTQDGTLPNDDEYLARVCRMDKRTWAKNRDSLLAFWTIENTRLYQKRLRDERIYVEQKRQKNIASGQASALKRKKRHSTNAPTPVEPKPNQPTPTPIILSEDKSSSSTPDGVSDDLWQEFLSIRKKLKAQNTPRAISSLHSELAKLKEQGFSPHDVVEQSVRNSWKDVFPIKDKTNANQRNSPEKRTVFDKFIAGGNKATFG